MDIDKHLAAQSVNYIYIPNNEIISFYYCENQEEIKEKDYIQKEFINGKDLVVVPSDSNCLVHSIMVSLYQFNFSNFINIIMTLSDEFGFQLSEPLFNYDPNVANYFNTNLNFFSVFAQHVVRQAIRKYWSYTKSEHEYHNNPDRHMNNYAIDGLGRNMLCKIFCIPKLIVYQAFDDESRKKGINEIIPETKFARTPPSTQTSQRRRTARATSSSPIAVAQHASSCRPPWLLTHTAATPAFTASSASSAVITPFTTTGSEVIDLSHAIEAHVND